jgi:hypothetical protein
VRNVPRAGRSLRCRCERPIFFRNKVDDDPDRALMFDFLRSRPGAPRVLTGHADGLITLNAEEADDAKREKIRHDLHEPYRTLLGHFRHEVGDTTTGTGWCATRAGFNPFASSSGGRG